MDLNAKSIKKIKFLLTYITVIRNLGFIYLSTHFLTGSAIRTLIGPAWPAIIYPAPWRNFSAKTFSV